MIDRLDVCGDWRGILAEVIQWCDHVLEPVATCSCGCTEFNILLDGYGRNWERITGTQCCECGQKIKWIVAEQVTERGVADDC